MDVFSPGGISLSPAFVIMFVMQHYRLSWEDALHMVQNRRYCISPNGGFLTQIKVCAKRVIQSWREDGLLTERGII
jgi:Dual specificity phosphatase, catalytic domain